MKNKALKQDVISLGTHVYMVHVPKKVYGIEMDAERGLRINTIAIKYKKTQQLYIKYRLK